MRKKLKDTRGETLVEVLVSILIGALSVAMLFGAAMTSGNIDRGAKKAEEGFVKSLNAAEEQTTAASSSDVPDDAAVTIKGKNAAGTEYTKSLDISKITFYGGEGALSYALTPP